jgi:hypothetical protein
LALYKLPKYLPVRIFGLEYIRQIINSDDIHFVSLKKKQQLGIKGQIGSFICNNRGTGQEVDRMLREMKFSMIFPWHYDPCGIISEMRVKNKNIPYVHVSRLNLIERSLYEVGRARSQLQKWLDKVTLVYFFCYQPLGYLPSANTNPYPLTSLNAHVP